MTSPVSVVSLAAVTHRYGAVRRGHRHQSGNPRRDDDRLHRA